MINRDPIANGSGDASKDSSPASLTDPLSSAGDRSAVSLATDHLESKFALLGNPNTGKTTLFNRLCGVRAHTANHPGTTVDARVGHFSLGRQRFTITDLPGTYSLALDLPEAQFCSDFLKGDAPRFAPPQAALVIVDSTNLHRHLRLVAEVLALRLPTIVALNMTDAREEAGIKVDVARLSERLGCSVVEISARSGFGIANLRAELPNARRSEVALPEAPSRVDDWVRSVYDDCVQEGEARTDTTDRLDALLTHRWLGPLAFTIVMGFLFWTIFALAGYPMEWIELIFEKLGGWVHAAMPEGPLRGLLVDGVIGGVAGTVVFLPQICLLFFMLTLLEDTGYMARAAFVVDRTMRRFGLPGQAFVPLLSSHACALPGIACARLIPDRRDRLATILVAPFMSCSARLPVYVLLTGLLFRDNALFAGLAFAGCYALGALAALFSARLARGTLLRGTSRPMVLELPPYRWPSLRNALLTALERGKLFLRKAGTVILAICIVLWWLSAYPELSKTPAEVEALRTRAVAMEETTPERVALEEQAESLEAKLALQHSFAGRLGQGVEPVVAPLGFDWQLSIAVVTSFAAREVFVSTLAVIFQTGEEEPVGVVQKIRDQKRADGTRLFTTATSASLLVFFVLALQCLPTLAVTRREAGGWSWALLQFGYMTSLAYAAALATYWGVRALGFTT